MEFMAKCEGDEGWAIVSIDHTKRIVSLKEQIMAKLKLDVSPATVVLQKEGTVARLDDKCCVGDVLTNGDCLVLNCLPPKGGLD